MSELAKLILWIKGLILKVILILILIIFGIANGWIKIVCDGNAVQEDIKNVIHSSSAIK